MSLLEKAQEVISEEEAMKATEKMMGGSGSFTFDDFVGQMKMINKMGSFGGLLKMLPGMGSIKDALDSVDTDAEMKKLEVIIQSMTKQERRNPDLLNGSRRARIAKGCGREVSDINSFVKRFDDMRKMMKQMGNMGGLMKGMGKAGAKQPDPNNPWANAGNPFARKGGKGFGRKF